MLRIAKTESGMVRGLPGSDVRNTIFRGIPFAADTSGDNRWRAPQPVEPWEGVRDCFQFAPITMQRVPGEDPNAFYSKEWHCEPEIAMSEDSLALNIWTPAKTGDEKMPVMVWIFGGGLQEGYCHEMEFDGEGLNRRGVILVSIAYRLNVFGFMAHPDLRAEDPDHITNFGLWDQKAGIEWVKRNIANFGGDPDNITIFGQSAGGGSTMYHVTSPQSAGLFKRAIPQSAGGIVAQYPQAFMPVADTYEEAEANGEKFVREVLGCSSIAEARKLDAKFIENKLIESGYRFNASIDGQFVVDQWYKRVLEGKENDVQLMTGNTTGEFPTIPQGDPIEWAKTNMGEYADKYIELCKAEAGDDPEALRKAMSFISFEISANMMSRVFAKHGRPVYYYEFGPTIPGDNAGPFHSSELWFTFESLAKCWRPFDGHHYDLARHMCNYWANFAKTGDPNGNDANGKPMPEWKKFLEDDRNIMNFKDEVYCTNAPIPEKTQYLVDNNLALYEY